MTTCSLAPLFTSCGRYELPSPQASKAKGRERENRCVTWMSRWWPNAERRRLNGTKDRGDLAGVPYVVEVKGEQRLCVPQYLRELAVEKVNAGEEHGFVMVWQNRSRPFFIVDEVTMEHFLDGLYGRDENGDERDSSS